MRKDEDQYDNFSHHILCTAAASSSGKFYHRITCCRLAQHTHKHTKQKTKNKNLDVESGNMRPNLEMYCVRAVHSHARTHVIASMLSQYPQMIFDYKISPEGREWKKTI